MKQLSDLLCHRAELNRKWKFLGLQNIGKICHQHLLYLNIEERTVPVDEVSCVRGNFKDIEQNALSKRAISQAFNKKDFAIYQAYACHYVKRNFHSSVESMSANTLSALHGEVDRYNGMWVDLSKTNQNLKEKEFEDLLKECLNSCMDRSITAVWLKVPITKSELIVVASKYGFLFHHAEGHHATLTLWMAQGSVNRLPMFATHQIGVSGLVIREDTQEVLAVQDKNSRFTLWKFPGGLSELGEDIGMTAEREVYEETGVKAEFQSILAFRQQHGHPGAFGRSDLYVLCRLKPLTFDLNPCEEEIKACEWMPIARLCDEVEASSLTHRLAKVVLYGLKHGFHHVDITSYQMTSIYKDRKFHLFHRPLR